MKKAPFLALLLAVPGLLLVGCVGNEPSPASLQSANAQSSSAPKTVIQEDIEKLAGGDRAKTARLLKLMQFIDVQFPENTLQIARQTLTWQERLQTQDKISQDMEMVLKEISEIKLENPKMVHFSNYMLTYYMARAADKKSHKVALEEVRKKAPTFKPA